MEWYSWGTLAIALGGFGLGLYNTFGPKVPRYALALERDEFLEFRLVNTGRRRVTVFVVSAQPGWVDVPAVFELDPGISRPFHLNVQGVPLEVPDRVSVHVREISKPFMLPVPYRAVPPELR